MSRLRTTLDSVTKAVGSTDLISKFSRFKPGNAAAAAATAVDSTRADKAETVASNTAPATASPPETTMKEEERGDGEKNVAEEQVTENPFVATKKSGLASAAGASPSTVAKQSMQLFHPAGLSSANMDETYKSLAQHINSYFGTSTHVEEGEGTPAQSQTRQDEPASEPSVHASPHQAGDHIPVLSPVASIKAPSTSPLPPPQSEKLSPDPPADAPAVEPPAQPVPTPAPTSRKGFTHYLSYPRPSVQAFVGNYIAPLVPKFRGDSKSITAEKEKVAVEGQSVEKTGEKTESEEEKAKQLLLTQREKVRCSVTHSSTNTNTNN